MRLTGLIRTDKMLLMKALRWIIFGFPIFYISSCALTSELKGRAFDAINVGDTEVAIIRLLGNPSVREGPDILFTRYATIKCQNLCVERFWFENRFAIGIEAWSVELGDDRRVVKKAHWVLP